MRLKVLGVRATSMMSGVKLAELRLVHVGPDLARVQSVPFQTGEGLSNQKVGRVSGPMMRSIFSLGSS